jgi:signal transduction histidine kinase
VELRLHGDDGTLSLTVADNGAGFDVDEAIGRGLGLLSMRERIEAIAGTLDIESKPGAGTLLKVTVPLRADSA